MGNDHSGESNALPDLHPKSATFFDHDLGEARWEHFVLAVLIGLAGLIVAETLARVIPVLCQRVLKIHETYNEVLATISLLTVSQGIPLTEAKELLKEYSAAHSLFISYYGSSANVNDILKRRHSYHSFYRTNFWELIYDGIRPVVYFFAFSAAFYVVRYDFISWINGIGLSSVIVLYGFMPYLQSYLAHLILVYHDKLRVGTLVEIPKRDKIGCVLELGAFSVKMGVLNRRILETLWANKEQVDKSKNVKIKIEKDSHKKKYSNEYAYEQDVSHFSTPFGMNIVGSDSHILSSAGGVPIFLPSLQQSPSTTRKHDETEEDPTLIQKTKLTEKDREELIQRILDYAYVPNVDFLQVYYETRQE